MKKYIISGDEAVARGAWEAGVTVAAAYPGTPSTEILENMAAYKDDIYCQWACNEKVAAEIAIGASVCGARSLVSMKHVGLNVAADPFFTLCYTGVNGGLVVVSADDPGCHSSQNEQDNRWYAKHAKCALIEPSDSQECLDFTKAAFELSEKFDTPVLLRMTTRVCHSKSIVEYGERSGVGVRPYTPNQKKYCMLPANARVRHAEVLKHLAALEEYACDCPLNRVERHDGAIGVISSGVSYQHAREAFGDTVSYLKLGLTNPMPARLIREFCESVGKVYIVEEGDGFIEETVRALGFDCLGKAVVSELGELDAAKVREAFGVGSAPETYASELKAPARPPVFCAGCPHRGFYFTLSKLKKNFAVAGDIGCYALGAQPPFEGNETTVCMGGGWSMPIGMAKALKANNDPRKALGVVGDSTFFHSGITGLVDAVHSKANVVLCLLDNSITAMTGHQENPGTSKDLMGYEVPAVDPLAVIRAVGLPESNIRVVDPLDLDALKLALDEAYACEGAFVVVARRPCALLKPVAAAAAGKYCEVDAEKCKGCKQCMKVACPALAFIDGKAVVADKAGCMACGLCMSQCKFGAISKVGC